GVRLYRLHGHPGSGCPDLRSKGPHPRERRPPLVLLRAPLPLAHAAIDAVGGDVPRQQRGRDPLRLGGPPLRAGPGVRARRARPDRGRRRRWWHLPLIRWLLRQLVELVLEQLVLLVVRLVGMVGRRRRLRRRRRHLLLVTGGCSLIDLPDRQPRSSHTTKATRLDPVDQSERSTTPSIVPQGCRRSSYTETCGAGNVESVPPPPGPRSCPGRNPVRSRPSPRTSDRSGRWPSPRCRRCRRTPSTDRTPSCVRGETGPAPRTRC